MTAYAYPSDQFPGPVPVRLRMPGGWQPAPTPGSAMAFVGGPVDDGVRASLVVSVQRVGGDPTLDEIAAKLRAQTEALARGNSTVLANDVRAVSGLPAIRTVVEIPVPQRSVTVVQAQIVLALDATEHGHRDVVQVTFTCEAGQWPAREPLLDGVLQSVEVGPVGTGHSGG